MSKPLTHRERIHKALTEHREAWDLESEAPQDWLDQVEADLVERLARETYPTHLVRAAKRAARRMEVLLELSDLRSQKGSTREDLADLETSLALYEETP